MSESVTCTYVALSHRYLKQHINAKPFFFFLNKQCQICLVQRKVTDKIKQAVCNKSRHCLRGHCNHITFVWNTVMYRGFENSFLFFLSDFIDGDMLRFLS